MKIIKKELGECNIRAGHNTTQLVTFSKSSKIMLLIRYKSWSVQVRGRQFRMSIGLICLNQVWYTHVLEGGGGVIYKDYHATEFYLRVQLTVQ